MKKTAKKSETERILLASMHERNRFRLILSSALACLLATTGIAASWMLGTMLDTVMDKNLDRLGRIAIGTAIFVPVMLLIEIVFHRIKTTYIHRGIRQYKRKAFSMLSEKAIGAFTHENTATYLSMLTNDAASIEENYLNHLPALLYQILQFIFAIGMMLSYSRLLTVIVIALCLLPVVVSLTMSKGVERRERNVSDQNEMFTARIKDLLSGYALIKSFRAEPQAGQLFARDNDELEHTKENKRWYVGLVNAVASVAGLVVQLSIFLIGAVFAIRGQITVGTVAIFLNLCNFLVQPIGTIPEYYAKRKAAEGLIKKHADLLTRHAEAPGAPVPQSLSRGISARSLSFGYEDGQTVLQNLDLDFAAGKSYCIVGASGSGKSTLLSLLLGTHRAYTGSLTLDGLEVKDADAGGLFDLVALVGQNVFLFDATIRENITMFGEFPDERVNDAIQKAGLADVIQERGEAYRCGENGGNLSGGERQRISIARALLRGARVLLVDEATSALDAKSAKHVSDSILSLDGLTRIVVTHRLEPAQLRRYDSILMLKNGVVAEQGDFDALMAQKGQFYALYTVTSA